MGVGFAPTWLRQVSPPASQNHFNHWFQDKQLKCKTVLNFATAGDEGQNIKIKAYCCHCCCVTTLLIKLAPEIYYSTSENSLEIMSLQFTFNRVLCKLFGAVSRNSFNISNFWYKIYRKFNLCDKIALPPGMFRQRTVYTAWYRENNVDCGILFF